VTQQLLKKKLALTVSGNDLFYTNRNEFTLDQGSVHAIGERRSDTPPRRAEPALPVRHPEERKTTTRSTWTQHNKMSGV
jgi:hypothetical protein